MPFFGVVWLVLVAGFEIFFLIAPASGAEVGAKSFVLLMGAAFVYVGVWLVRKPSRYEVCYEDRDVLIRLVPLFGDCTERRIRADQIRQVDIDISENSEGVVHHRVLIGTTDGAVHDLLPTLSPDRARQAQRIINGLIGRAQRGGDLPRQASFDAGAADSVVERVEWGRQWNAFGAVMVGLVCCSIAVYSAQSGEDQSVPGHAPDLEAYSRLEEINQDPGAPCFEKRFCLVVAVASWCSASQRSEPAIASLRRRFEGSDVGVLIAVSDDDASTAERYAKRFGSSAIVDPGGSLGRLLGDWRFPSWWVVEDNSAVRAYWRGGYVANGAADNEVQADFFANYLKVPALRQRD